MSFVITARWIAKETTVPQVREVIERLVEPTRAEPGCIEYVAHQSRSDLRVFLIYEVYIDEAAYEAHQQTRHFERYARQSGFPLLESREREYYEILEPRHVTSDAR